MEITAQNKKNTKTETTARARKLFKAKSNGDTL